MKDWKDELKNQIVESGTKLPENWKANLTEQLGFVKNVCNYPIINIIGKKFEEKISNENIAFQMEINQDQVNERVGDALTILKKYNPILIYGYDYCLDNNLLSPELEEVGLEKSSIEKLANAKIYTPIQVVNANSSMLKNLLGNEYDSTMESIESEYDNVVSTADIIKNNARSEEDHLKEMILPYVGKILEEKEYRNIMNSALSFAGLPTLEKHLTRNSVRELLDKLGHYRVDNLATKGMPGFVEIKKIDWEEEMRKKKVTEQIISNWEEAKHSKFGEEYGIDEFTMRYLVDSGIRSIEDVDKIENNFMLTAALCDHCSLETNKVRTILIDALKNHGYDTIRFGVPLPEVNKEDRALTNVEVNDLKADNNLTRLFGFRVTEENKKKAIDYVNGLIGKEFSEAEIKNTANEFSRIWRGLETDKKPMAFVSFKTYLMNYHLSVHKLENGKYVIETKNNSTKKAAVQVPPKKDDVKASKKEEVTKATSKPSDRGCALNEDELLDAIKCRPAVEAKDMVVSITFKCPICGKDTFYSTTVESTLSSVDKIIYCGKCFNKIRIK